MYAVSRWGSECFVLKQTWAVGRASERTNGRDGQRTNEQRQVEWWSYQDEDNLSTISNDSRFDYHRNGFELSIIMALIIITYTSVFSVNAFCNLAFWWILRSISNIILPNFFHRKKEKKQYETIFIDI